MPEYQSFLSGGNLMQFWENVKWFLFFVSPIILIFFATDVIGNVIRMIRGSITDEAKKEDEEDDIYYY
jgi:hypothetical protein